MKKIVYALIAAIICFYAVGALFSDNDNVDVQIDPEVAQRLLAGAASDEDWSVLNKGFDAKGSECAAIAAAQVAKDTAGDGVDFSVEDEKTEVYSSFEEEGNRTVNVVLEGKVYFNFENTSGALIEEQRDFQVGMILKKSGDNKFVLNCGVGKPSEDTFISSNDDRIFSDLYMCEDPRFRGMDLEVAQILARVFLSQGRNMMETVINSNGYDLYCFLTGGPFAAVALNDQNIIGQATDSLGFQFYLIRAADNVVFAVSEQR